MYILVLLCTLHSNFAPLKKVAINLFIYGLDPVVAMYYKPEENGETYQRAPAQNLFLWGQSVFIIAQLLTAGLLHINELDPIRRYLPSYNRPRKGGRYSAFQVSDDLNMNLNKRLMGWKWQTKSAFEKLPGSLMGIGFK